MMRTRIPILALALLLIPTLVFSDPGIRWKDYRSGTALALQEGKKIVLHFHAEWCPSCKQMKKETLSNPEVPAPTCRTTNFAFRPSREPASLIRREPFAEAIADSD